MLLDINLRRTRFLRGCGSSSTRWRAERALLHARGLESPWRRAKRLQAGRCEQLVRENGKLRQAQRRILGVRHTCLLAVLAVASGAAAEDRLQEASGSREAEAIAAAVRKGGAHPALEMTPADVLAELKRFYSRRGHLPAWSGDPDSSRELIAALEAAGEEGLDPNDYQSRSLRALVARSTWTVAEELSLTRAFLLYAHHLHGGRVSPQSAGSQITPEGFDGAALLEEALAGVGIRSALESANPAAVEFVELRRHLRELMSIARAGGWPRIPVGMILERGTGGDRVGTLRARLRASGDLAVPAGEQQLEITFNSEVEEAVRCFQRRHGLDDDGRVGARTLAALNVSVASRIGQVHLNLERMRWMPRSRGARHILVNIPAFELRALSASRVVLTSAVVVGERDWPTPVIRDAVASVDVHPRWVIPPKIARQEIVPLLARAAGYAERVNLRIFARATGEEVNPRAIDWMRVSARGFAFVQEPGPENPLGDTRLALRNTRGVHLHATPRTDTFLRAYRATSHGCIRVQRSHDLARFALADPDLISRYEAALASETSEQLVPPEPVPVFLAYFTAWVDENRIAQFRPDIYRLDARLDQALRRRRRAPALGAVLPQCASDPGLASARRSCAETASR